LTLAIGYHTVKYDNPAKVNTEAPTRVQAGYFWDVRPWDQYSAVLVPLLLMTSFILDVLCQTNWAKAAVGRPEVVA